MAGVVLAVGVLSVVRSDRPAAAELARALMLSLELLLAAGLLRLGMLETFSALGLVAVTIVVRQMIGLGLRLTLRSAQPQGPDRRSSSAPERVSPAIESEVRRGSSTKCPPGQATPP